MRHLSKNEVIAVAAGLFVIAYLFFSTSLLNLFNPNTMEQESQSSTENTYVVQDVVVGQGAIAESGDTLTVHYVGTLTDGRVFDSSRDRNTPFTFTLGGGQVIRGWDEGLVGMRVGGIRRLTISPAYGYGAAAVGPIPPNSTLIFEVELLNAQ